MSDDDADTLIVYARQGNLARVETIMRKSEVVSALAGNEAALAAAFDCGSVWGTDDEEELLRRDLIGEKLVRAGVRIPESHSLDALAQMEIAPKYTIAAMLELGHKLTYTVPERDIADDDVIKLLNAARD